MLKLISFSHIAHIHNLAVLSWKWAMDLICTYVEAWTVFVLVFFTNPFFFFFSQYWFLLICPPPLSVPLETNSQASIYSISSGKWKLVGLVFLVFFVHNCFLVLFLSSLRQSRGYYSRVTIADWAVNYFKFSLWRRTTAGWRMNATWPPTHRKRLTQSL